MDNPTPPLQPQAAKLREAYAALNRSDLSAFADLFDPQVERIEPPDFPQGGTYRGIEAVMAHIAKSRATWAEGGCEPQRFIVAGDRVVALVHVRVRLSHETQWRDGRAADVYTFRDGKAVQFRTFADQAQALEWAGVNAPGAR